MVTCRPVASSESMGKVVRKSTVAAMPTRIRLLNRKLDSRERTDSSLASERRSGSRRISSSSEPKKTRPRK